MRLKELRGNRTQGKLATELGLARATYSNYENGTREPDINTLKQMAVFFNVTIDYLLGRTEKTQSIELIEPTLAPQELEILHNFRQLSIDQKTVIENMLNGLVKANKTTTTKRA